MPVSALSQAIDLAQAPRLAAHMRQRPLPRDVLTLITLASGCPKTGAAAAASTKRDPDFIVAAAELYLRQVVCFPGADPHRTLGVSARASRAELRLHMRELVLWLHPDRKGTGWDAALMQRVMEAWRSVSGPERHASAPLRPSAAGAPKAGRTRRAAAYRPTWISQPLPKARRHRPVRGRSPAALRVVIVMIAMVVPEFAVLSPPSLADGPQLSAGRPRAPNATRPIRPEPPRLRTDFE